MRQMKAKVKPRHKLKRPQTLVALPKILEKSQFMPLLDPLTEQTSEDDHPGTMAQENHIAEKRAKEIVPKMKKRPCAMIKRPVTIAEQRESKIWTTRIVFCSWWQLAAIQGKVDEISASFKCHPFRYLDHRKEVVIRKRAA